MQLLPDDRHEKALSLLHSLNVGLQTARQLLDELVPWDVIGRLRNEQLWAIILIVRCRVDYLDGWHCARFLQLASIDLHHGVMEYLLRVILHKDRTRTVVAARRWQMAGLAHAS